MLPQLSAQTGELLNKPIEHWDEAKTPLLGTPVEKFKPLLQRVDADAVQAMFAASVESA